MKHLTLPRVDDIGIPYLSYSQITTWKRSKKQYMKQYFFKEPFDGNAYTDFGKKVGTALELNDYSGFTQEEIKVLQQVPRYDEFEKEIKLQMKGFYVLGYIDTNSKLVNNGNGVYIEKIADYKTGDIKKKVAEYESDDYTQLDIYAASLLQKYDRLPDKIYVHLIDRKGNAFRGEPLVLGDGHITIKRQTDKKRISKILKDIQEVGEDIEKCYKVFLKLNKN